jgi:hypothetical protein
LTEPPAIDYYQIMLVACDICGTLHRAISHQQAQEDLRARTEAWTGLGNPPDLEDYWHCCFCGGDRFCAHTGGGAQPTALIIWEKDDMRADELHPYGTYAELVPDAATRDLLAGLAETLGVTNPTPPEEFHTTLIYSRRPCPSVQDLDGTPFPHAARITGLKTWDTRDGTRCLVALLDGPELVQLHHTLRDQHGATHDFPDYQPHFTLSYDCGDGDMVLPPGDHRVGYERVRVKPLDPKWGK